MQEPVLRKLLLAFIELHILHHAKERPIYGSWMMEELQHHGYHVSAGTLYPIFHNLEKAGLLLAETKSENGRRRKYYTLTPRGTAVLAEAKDKIEELRAEM
ncbi:MAG: PadR family transcriptional regulator [Pygmaiobacter sp.]|nr:PadR family transcriptional regulator [Pygmaiobacter sp.]